MHDAQRSQRPSRSHYSTLPLTVDHLRTIPPELQARPQWVAWRTDTRIPGRTA